MIRLLAWCFAFASVLTQTLAEPISLERIQSLPTAERAAWTAYLERSRANAAADAAAVRSEVAALK